MLFYDIIFSYALNATQILTFGYIRWTLDVACTGSVCVCVCVCVCFRPPVCAVCSNHEVVEFQPRTVITPDLGSFTNTYNYSIPTAPPVPTVFWIFVSPSPWTYLLPPPPKSHGYLMIAM